MYAIVETCGKQYRVEAGQELTLDRLQADVGAEVVLDRVLLVGGDGVKVGNPLVDGATVTAKVVDHGKGKKVITFKYRRRHRTRRKVGFRASQTTLEIVSIDA
jgi:large subunit ribosomal protein L21